MSAGSRSKTRFPEGRRSEGRRACVAPRGTGLAVRVGLVAAIAGGSVGAGPVDAQQREPFLGQAAYLFTNVILIDGRGGQPRPNTAVLVWDGSIQAVGSVDQILIPEGTRVVDLDGLYMLPGLIDAYAMPADSADFADLLAAGVTAVRSGGLEREEWDALGSAPQRWDPGPRVYSSGPLLDAGEDATGLVLRDEADAAAAVERLVELEVDFLTLSPRVTPELTRAVTRSARERDKRVWGDLRSTSWVTGVRERVDVMSRLASGDPDLLDEAHRPGYLETLREDPSAAMAEWLAHLDPEGAPVDRMVGALLSRDVAVVPLLAAAQAPLLCPEEEGDCGGSWPDSVRAVAAAAWPKLQQLTRLLHAEGVRLLAGSGGPATGRPGASLHRELELLVEAGLPPLDVLSMATRNVAVALDVLHERGTIEVGKRADLVVFAGNPTVDIRNTRNVEFVVIDGKSYRARQGGFERLEFR